MPLAVFGIVATAVYATALVIVRAPAFAAGPDLLAFGVATDLAVGVPLAYWALVVRRGAATLRSLLPVVALSVLGARLVLPAEHRSFLGLVRYATAPLEFALVGCGVWRARQALHSASASGDGVGRDTAEALEQGFVAALGDRAVARVVAAEVATLYYALFARVIVGPARADALAFSHDTSQSAATTWGFGLAVTVETIAVHFWLVRAHPVVAWVLVALSAYSVLWFVGHHRATGLRPVVLAGDTLAVRAGLRLTARVPLAAVEAADEVSWRDVPAPAAGYLDAARPGAPNLVLTLGRPAVVTGPFGLRRTVTRIGLRLDDPAGFVAAVRPVRGLR